MLATAKKKSVTARPAGKPVALRPRELHRSHLEVVAPPSRSASPWFLLLLTLRKVSTPLVLLLTFSILPLYGWTVSTQRNWGQTYAQLEQLKRDERNLLLQHETRQHHINENAEKNPVGLTPKGPHNTLFVKPEPAHIPQAAPVDEEPSAPLQMSPIGY
ncbi:hypothetical protein C1752_03319 [Acaryochloris thomasi RCC1774]|uniref:Cell division protein FtsL n=1 Tax=Acaryochloris thomasi RCC1774 TaxID=1764569 RepID=A0A2W1JN29_9CYAN|nr:hypothetical protein [Acaryochloris thomasi]PZD72855.1 hypothetical protein C1752_03319 [Acaryochloris thomasi RCC1774]